jgi:hypothetical protein
MQSRIIRTVTAVTTEPCSINVTLFALTNLTLIAAMSMQIRYTLYPYPRDGAGPSGQAGGGGQQGALLQLGMVQPSYTSPLTTYLRYITIQILNYLMRILMEVT